MRRTNDEDIEESCDLIIKDYSDSDYLAAVVATCSSIFFNFLIFSLVITW